MKKVDIRLHEWHYQCGDGCCDLYGTDIYLNDEKVGEQYDGDSVPSALKVVLEKLGYEVKIESTYG